MLPLQSIWISVQSHFEICGQAVNPTAALNQRSIDRGQDAKLGWRLCERLRGSNANCNEASRRTALERR